LGSAAGDRQELSRKDQESACEQRDQRKHVQVRAVGAREARAALGFIARRRDEYTGRYFALDHPFKCVSASTGRKLDVDAVKLTDPIEPRLSIGDVHHRERLSSGPGWQQCRDAKRDRVDTVLQSQDVSGFESKMIGGGT
jgi:hypothetical protein